MVKACPTCLRFKFHCLLEVFYTSLDTMNNDNVKWIITVVAAVVMVV